MENPQRLLHATYTDTITAPKTGYIAHIQSEEVGLAAMTAGGGRETKDSVIDLSAGIVLNKKVGDFVKENEPLARLYAMIRLSLKRQRSGWQAHIHFRKNLYRHARSFTVLLRKKTFNEKIQDKISDKVLRVCDIG